VYANPEKYPDAASLDALYTEIVSGYVDPQMFTGPSYWRRVAFDWPGYYINYGISMIPCLELYYLAESDYESAAQTYLSLSDYEGTLTFSEVLERAVLQNPLDEEYQIFDLEALLALMQQKQSS
jgi:oligoendopeptidase F